MAIERKKVGKTERYKGSDIEVRFMGPDLLAYVDGMELPNFYLDAEAARAAGRRYVDEEQKERKAKAS